MDRDTVEQTLSVLNQGLHQDSVAGHPTMEELAGNCVASLSRSDLQELKPAVEYALDNFTTVELKGLLNRMSDSFQFGSKASRDFFRAVRDLA